MERLAIENLDFFLIVLLILVQVGLGIFISRKGKGSEDYFMAGRKLPWWVVGGSVFSTNVSASHLIGMLGIGYSVGFAQSHYEVLAVFAIFILAFLFVPIYRKLPIFTLSQFLEKRFGERVRLTYALLVIILIVVQLVGHFYIGARALAMLTEGSKFEMDYPTALFLLTLISCSYTFFGGLSAVVYTDTLQAVFIIAVAVLLCFFTFAAPEINGFSGLLALEENLPVEDRKMKLYLPANHPDLPFTGVFTGLIFLHFFYWITNQYLVQRVMAAKSNDAAKIGVMVAGFLKLGIPFLTISTGVAAAHLLEIKYGNQAILPDDAFLFLVNAVIPAGFGLIGILISGVLASTFSTIDSMMNSATTLFCVDIYKRYLKKGVSDDALVRVGRILTGLLAMTASTLAFLTYSPQSAGNFFLKISSHGSYVTPGIIVVFFAAVFVKKIPAAAAWAVMLSAPFISLCLEWIYPVVARIFPAIVSLFGQKLNFLHRVALTVFLCTAFLFILKRIILWQKKDLKNHSIHEEESLMAFRELWNHRWVIFLFFLLNGLSIFLLSLGIFTGKDLASSIALLSGLLMMVNVNPFSVSLAIPRITAFVIMTLSIWILYWFS
jgi:SSS family solute:Na+ symporter